MGEELKIERIVELEKELQKNLVILNGLYTPEELEYIHLGKKIPYSKVMEYLNNFKNNRQMDEYLFYLKMSEHFKVSFDELVKRLEYIELLRNYSFANNYSIAILFDKKRLLELEHKVRDGLTLLDSLCLNEKEIAYVRLIKDIPFESFDNENQLIEVMNSFKRKEVNIRGLVHLEIKRYLLRLPEEELTENDYELIRFELMARENRQMVKRMNESRRK